MTEIQQEEKQQELFPSFEGKSKKPERFPALAKSYKPILISTTIEQIILVCIVLILTACLMFFLGVLRGKLLSKSAYVRPILKTVQPAAVVPPRVAASPIPASIKPAAQALKPQRTDQIQNNNKPYTIQVSTYKKQDLAEKEAVALRRSGYYSAIIESGDYYIVCVGQYISKDAAKKDLKTLNIKYKGCFLRRRPQKE